jgi:hypothetical protein
VSDVRKEIFQSASMNRLTYRFGMAKGFGEHGRTRKPLRGSRMNRIAPQAFPVLDASGISGAEKMNACGAFLCPRSSLSREAASVSVRVALDRRQDNVERDDRSEKTAKRQIP